MKYQYNYSFLSKWIKANKKISDKTIMQAIGSSSNNSLALYEQGKCPMPVISILRFCNTFNVPISAILVDKDQQKSFYDTLCDDQFEPSGGYLKHDERRSPGSRTLRDPLDVDNYPSVVPGIHTEDIQAEKPSEQITSNKSSRKEELNISLSAIIDIEHKRVMQESNYTDERKKLLDIIAEQQKTIADLTSQLINRSANYGMPPKATYKDMVSDGKEINL